MGDLEHSAFIWARTGRRESIFMIPQSLLYKIICAGFLQVQLFKFNRVLPLREV